MTISFRCGSCGKKVEAPEAAGGKRGKCPYCKQSNYIPMPVAETELIDLAPEDEQEERRIQAEREALRQKEQELVAEMGRDEASAVPLEHRQDLKAADVEHLIVNYCLDMAGSKLDKARADLQEMRKVRATAKLAVEGFLSGKLTDPALKRVHPKLLQGFLTQLRKELT